MLGKRYVLMQPTAIGGEASMGAIESTTERQAGLEAKPRGRIVPPIFRADWDWIAFGGIAAVAAVAIAYFGRGWSFFYDEWGVIQYRRSGGLSAFLAPLNGHLLAVPIAIYRLLFATVGLSSYTPYRWVMVAAHVGLAALLYAYARRRLPRALALVSVTPILLLGYAWEVLFWMMNLGFVIPLIAFLGNLLLADRGGRWSAPARAGLLAVALASSGLGVAVTAGALVDSAAVRRRWRVLPWLILPALCYGVWFLFYRPGANTPAVLRRIPGAGPHGDVGALGFSTSNLHAVPSYLMHITESSASGLLGAQSHLRWAVLIAALIVLGIIVTRRVTPRLIAIAVAAVVFWVLAALVRAEAQQPNASRYIYPGAVFLVLLIVEAWAGFPWMRLRSLRLRQIAFVALLCGVLITVGSGLSRMRTVGDGASRAFAKLETALARVQCSGAHFAPTYAPDAKAIPVRVGTYLAAIQDLGSPVPARIVQTVCKKTSRVRDGT